MSQSRKTPTWAVVVGILGIFFFLIGLLFFFVKETVPGSRITIYAKGNASCAGDDPDARRCRACPGRVVSGPSHRGEQPMITTVVLAAAALAVPQASSGDPIHVVGVYEVMTTQTTCEEMLHDPL